MEYSLNTVYLIISPIKYILLSLYLWSSFSLLNSYQAVFNDLLTLKYFCLFVFNGFSSPFYGTGPNVIYCSHIALSNFLLLIVMLIIHLECILQGKYMLLSTLYIPPSRTIGSFSSSAFSFPDESTMLLNPHFCTNIFVLENLNICVCLLNT